jgi:hypothetical protein
MPWAERDEDRETGRAFMGKVSATDAAFYGFGLIKRDPLTYLGVALVLSGVGVYFGLVVIPAYLRMVAGLITEISKLQAETPAVFDSPDMEPVLAVVLPIVFGAMAQVWSAIGPFYLIGLVAATLMLGAFNRSLVFGKSKGWLLGLKLGMDELRTIIVTIAGYLLAFIPGYLVILLGVTTVIGVGFGVAAGVQTGGIGEGAAAGLGLLAVLACIAAIVGGFILMIWIGVRLSLAAPASVGERRFVIFESWSMTKGRFWTLFLAYLLYFIVMYVIQMVVSGVVMTVIGVSMMSLIASIPPTATDAEVAAFIASLADIQLTPTLLAWAIGGAVFYGLFAAFCYGAFLGVAARVYRDWKAQTGGQLAPA